MTQWKTEKPRKSTQNNHIRMRERDESEKMPQTWSEACLIVFEETFSFRTAAIRWLTA